MNKDEALKMAIELLEMHLTTNDRTFIERTATLQACKEALEQPTMTYEQVFDYGYEAHRVEQELEQQSQEHNFYINAKPSENYSSLLKQFYALRNLANSLDEQLKFYREQDYKLSKEQLDALEDALESEKAMNAKLTQELEQPTQEPVAIVESHYGFTDAIVTFLTENNEQLPIGTLLYAGKE